MAIVGGNQDDEELNKQSAGKATGGGEGGFVAGGTGQGSTTKTAATPTSSGGYTNLSSYLQANQDAGATTGKAAEGVVDRAGSAAKTAQGDYGDSANSEIDAATAGVNPNQSVLDNIKGGGAKADKGLAAIKSGIATVDPEAMGAIAGGGNAATGTYGGPAMPDTTYKGQKQTADAYSGLNPDQYTVKYGGGADTGHLSGGTMGYQAAATGANQDVYGKAGLAQGGQAGVSSLLQQAYKQPSYTHGENNLDAFLAGGTSGGKEALGQAADVAKDTAGGYENLNNMLSGKIASGQSQAKMTNASYDEAHKNAVAQTGHVQDQLDQAYNLASNDHSAADAYGAARDKAAAGAAQAKATADAKAAEEAKARAAAAPAPKPAASTPKATGPNPNNLTPSQIVQTVKKGSIASAQQDSKPAPINAHLADTPIPAKVVQALNPVQQTKSAYQKLMKTVRGW